MLAHPRAADLAGDPLLGLHEESEDENQVRLIDLDEAERDSARIDKRSLTRL